VGNAHPLHFNLGGTANSPIPRGYLIAIVVKVVKVGCVRNAPLLISQATTKIIKADKI